MAGIVQDKVAIVTGAGRGIGRAIAMLMANTVKAAELRAR